MAIILQEERISQKDSIYEIIDSKKYIEKTLDKIFTKNIIIDIIVKTITRDEIHEKNFEKIFKIFVKIGKTYGTEWKRLNKNQYINANMVKEAPHAVWNWSDISRNSKYIIELVKEFPTKRWDFYKMSKNKYITEEFVKGHLDENWNFNALVKNPNITHDFLYENDGKITGWYPIYNNPATLIVKFYRKANGAWCISYDSIEKSEEEISKIIT